MPQREPALRWLRDCALTALVLALCTLTSWVFFRLDFVSSNYILTYILGVMYINVFTSGLVYGVVASLFSVMLVNYMFIDPFMQFRIRSDDMVTAVVMLCVSLLCSSLTGRIKVQAAQSERKAYASQVLLEASRSLLGAEDPDTILRITATQLGKLLERPVCFAPAPEHIAPGTLILPPPAQTDYRSCPALHEFSTYEHNLALSILDVCSLALEKEASNRARREIEEAARQEQLRANLLRSISHDLRTPLTSISGNADVLLDQGSTGTAVLDAQTRRGLLLSIRSDAQWLNATVENLLAITKLEGGGMHLSTTLELMDDIVEEALRHVNPAVREHDLKVVACDEPALVNVDARLMVQLVVNLVNNAITYTPAGSHIMISISVDDGRVACSVADDGPGIAPEDRERIFESFYTANHGLADSHRSVGLGLSLCRSIALAHGGSIEVAAADPHGSVFTIELPAADVSFDKE